MTPLGTSIIATMKPALAMLIDLLAGNQARGAGRPRAAGGTTRGDPIPVGISAAHARGRDAG